MYPVEAADVMSVELRELNMYVTVGLYENGEPGEVFVSVSRSEPDLATFIGAFCAAMSVGLQHGIPLAWYCDKFVGAKAIFSAPAHTTNPEIPDSVSPLDYLMRWLRLKFLNEEA